MKRINVSDLAGTAGKAIQRHSDDLLKCSSMRDIRNFINMISSEISESSRKYILEQVRPDSPRTNFNSAQRCLYNIYLAGFSDCKVH